MAIYDVDVPVQNNDELLTSGPGVASEDKPSTSPLVDYVVSRFTEYESSRKPLETKWDTWYRMWRCLEDPEDQTTDRPTEKSQIKIPTTKEAVTNATDSLYQVLFPADYFDVRPQPTDLFGLDPIQAEQLLADKTHRAAVLKQYHTYLQTRENLPNKLYRFIQDVGIYGTGVLRIRVAKRMNKQVQRLQPPPTVVPNPNDPAATPLDVIESAETIRTVEQTVNHPETTHVPIECIYTNLNATNFQRTDGCEGVIQRSYAKTFEVMERFQLTAEQFKNLAPSNTDEIKQNRFSRQGLAYQPGPNDIELMDYWGFVPNDVLEAAGLPTDPNQLGAEMNIVVGNRSMQIHFEANPFPAQERPFLKFCFEEVNNEFYGLGIAEVSDGPQRAINAMFRCRLDNMALSLNSIFGINFDKLIPGQNLSLYPGKAFLFHGPPSEALFPIVIPDVTANVYRDAEAMKQVIQSAHGVSPMLGGQSAKGGEQTATEVSMLMAQSSSKIKTIAQRFERDITIPLLKWYTRIILQYLNEEEIFSLVDPITGDVGFLRISPNDVAQDYEFVPRGVIRMQAANEATKYMQALQASANPVDSQIVNRKYLWVKFYEALGLDDLQAAILTTPPQPQPMQPGMLPSQPGAPQPAPVTNPTAANGPVPTGPMTNTAEQPGGMLNMPSVLGGTPNG